ncbi:Ig-like domain-containing protein, partial [Alteromonas sp. 1_MG-2023]|uniref:Ig-like domain-containing protein n=1 Tax=Alteromonas sp. 1_MG-2023 TaxID=3062669 RepID=UPI0026E1D7CD
MADVIILEVNGEAVIERFETGEQTSASENVRLSEGDSLNIPDGSTVLVSVDGVVRELPSGQTVTFPLQLDFTDDNSDDQFAVFDDSVEDLNALLDQTGDGQQLDQDFLDVLAGDEDILESLEATATGLDGGGAAGGSNFVRVDRVNESVDPVSFEYEQETNDNETLTSEQSTDSGDEAFDIELSLDALPLDNDATPTLSGTTDATAGSTVTLTVTDNAGNVQTLTTTVQADGTFTIDVPAELAEGDYTVEASVTDAAGNTATDTNTGEIDTTAPDISLDAQGTGNDTTPTLSGTSDAAPGSTVTLTVTDSAGNVQTLTTTVQADGTFTIDVPAELAEGDYTVEASVTDAAGNTATDINTGEIDTTAPDISLDAQGTGNDTTPTLSGTSDATAGSTVTLTVTDSAGNVQTLTTTVQADGTFTIDVPAELAEGDYTVEASVTDAAGNTATDTNTGEIDTTAPDISLDAQGTGNDTTPTLSGTSDAAPGSTVTLTVTDSAGNVQTLTTTVQADGTFTIDIPAELAEGDYTVEASVTDAAGNTATDTNTGEIDTTAPDIFLDAQGTGNDTTPTLSGTSDAAPGSTVTLTVTDSAGNVQTLTTTVQADGTFTIDVPAELAEGDYTVEASVTDAAGNTATDTNTGEIDTTAPNISLDAQDTGNNTTPTLSGTSDATAGSTVTLTVTDSAGNVQTLTTTVQADGTFTIDVPAELAEGDYTVEASVTDAAGNTATDTNTGEIDTTAPNISLEAQDAGNDTTPTLSGTSDAAPGSTVTLTVTDSAGNVQTLTTTVQADGTFTLDIPAELAEGNYTVEASVTDTAGNTATDSFSAEIDVTGPTITLDNPGVNGDPTPTLSGLTNALLGTSITFTVTDSAGNTQTFTTVVEANGTFSVEMPDELAEGTFEVSASIADELGNTTETTTSGEYNATSPAIVVDQPDPTNQTTPTITGDTNAPEGSEVVIVVTDSEGNEQTITTTVGADGSFSDDVTDELSEGEFTVDVTVTTPDGNSSTSTVTGEVNTTAPVISLDAISTTNDDIPVISGNSDADAGSEVTLEIVLSDGSTQIITAIVQEDGSFSAEVPAAIADGDVTVNATVTDNAGNTSSTSVNAAINANGPNVITEPNTLTNGSQGVSGSSDTPNSDVAVVITDGAGNSQTVSGSTDENGNFTVDLPEGIDDGEYTVDITVTDSDGNSSTTTSTTVIDTTPPVITIDPQADTNNTSPIISGSSDLPEGSEVTITVTDSEGNEQNINTVVDENGNFTADLTDALPEGEYTVSVGATDEAGNTTTTTDTSGNVDTTQPSLTIDPLSTSNDGTPLVSGSTDQAPGSTVTLIVTDSAGNEQTITATVDEDGNFSVETSTALTEGEFSVEASVTDDAGNTTTVTETGGVVDTQAPTITLNPTGTGNDTTPTVSGATDLPAGSEVTLTATDSAGNIQTFTAVVDTDGTFAADVPSELLDGEFTIEATATDSAGNSSTATETGTVDTSAPSLALNTLGNDNDTTPTISGNTDLPAGSTVTLTVTDALGNSQTFTAAVDANGNFSTDVPSPLAEGDYDVTATATDSSGNTATASETGGNIDITSPRVNLETQGSTNDASPTIFGTTDQAPGSTVAISVTDSEGDTQSFTATVDENGAFSAEVPVELADGEYTVTATISDDAGNQDTASTDGTIDTAAPTLSLDPLSNDNDSTPAISGTSDLPEGSTVTLVITDGLGNQQTIEVSVDENGGFNAEVPSPLAEGDYSVTATATDTSGNTASTTESGGTVDTTAPQITLDEQGTGNDATPTLSGTSDLPQGSIITLTVTDSAGDIQTINALVNADGSFSIDAPEALAEGDYSVTATAQDEAGNQASATENGSIDTNAPALSLNPLTESNDNSPVISGATSLPEGSTVTISVVDNAGNTQTFTADVDAQGNFSAEVPDSLPDGDYSVTVNATDPQGNTASVTETGGVVDTTPPTLNLNNLGSTNDTTPTISGSTDLPEGSLVSLQVTDSADNVQTINVLVDSDGNFNVDVPTELADGDYTVEASATDANGNSETADTTGTVDATAPELTLDPQALTTDTTPTISGNTDVEAGSLITITVVDSAGNSQTFQASVQGDGSFEADVPNVLAEGDYTVTATVSDTNGNQAIETAAGGSVDSQAPTVNLNPLSTDNDTTPTISGNTNLPEGAVVVITVTDSNGDSQTINALVDDSGNFITDVLTPLAEGDYSVTATATDNAGNSAADTETGGTIDTSAPTAPVVNAGNGTEITGTAEAGALVSIDIDGDGTPDYTVTADGAGNWSVTPDTPLADGVEVTATATDEAGNESAPTADTVDAAAPVVTINDVTTNDTTPELTGTVNDP